MGSSFAAGPGIPTYVDDPPQPCTRSSNNYAHQLARRLNLSLTDVGCSGGTTSHLLGARGDIAPQLDALTADTRLVTITIGGNDIGYMTRLINASCAGLEAETGTPGKCNPIPALPTESDYAALAGRMDQIARTVRQRAPQARLIFVDYLTVIPQSGRCAATPLSDEQASIVRAMEKRLAAITRKAASDNDATIVTASEFSKGHDACSSAPFMNGYPRPNAPVAGAAYHPNLAGMTAVADALEKALR
jgi:lysophospholipase L1-like esterase